MRTGWPAARMPGRWRHWSRIVPAGQVAGSGRAAGSADADVVEAAVAAQGDYAGVVGRGRGEPGRGLVA